MYSSHRLDTPPPSSHFTHRPWSPDPHDTLPSLRNQYAQQTPLAIEDYYHWDAPRNQLQRREASDDSVSVQALDLAEYANTLRPWRGGAQQTQIGLEYPPSPIPARPFSRDSFTNDLPSLSSSVPSAESSTPPYSDHSLDSRRRPFSLPPPSSSYNAARFPGPYQTPYIAHPSGSLDRIAEYPGVHDGEVDIAHFPAFSKSWYANEDCSPRSPLSKEHPSAAFFDPTYPSSTLPSHLTNPYSVDTFASAPHPLPWSGTDPYGVPLNAEVKEERMRMLEQEFGAKNVGQPVEEQTIVGSVDARGKLITQGPKKRTATRVVEVLMAVGIAGSSFYAALKIKPSSTPPPQGKPYTYVLYILSILTILVMFYLFAIRPCCGGRGKSRGPQFTGPGGMMVLPVSSLPGGEKKKKKKKGKKGQQDGGGVQVNLIVDPTMFGHGPRREEEEEEGAGNDEYSSSVSFGGRSGAARRPKRRNVFEGLAMEEQWLKARKELKWLAFADCLFLLLWGVEFVWILIGERCPPGQYDGWCTAYNVASALACLLAVTYGLSIFFDIKDLYTSKVSPRQRT